MRLRVEPNTFHLVMDIAWFGIAFAATSRFLVIYAIRLGASPGQLTMLTALPALALLASSLSSSWWRRRFPDSVRAVMLPALGMRMVFLLPIFTPLLPSQFQLTWLIISVTLPALPQGVASVIFWGLLREAVYERDLKPLFGWRMAALNLALGAGVIGFAFCLEEVAFPRNYQLVFGMAFLASLASFWHMRHVKVLPELLPPAPTARSFFPKGLRQNQDFGDVTMITLLTHVAFFSVFPLVPLWIARELQASDRFLLQFGLIELYAGAAVSLIAPRLMRRLRYRTLISGSMMLTALAVGVMVVGASIPTILLAAALIGIGWTLVSVGVQAMFMQAAPSHSTTAYATLFSQVLFLSTAIGPFIGSLFIYTGFDLGKVLLIGVGLRVVVGVIVWMWPVIPSRTRPHTRSRSTLLRQSG